MLLYLQSNKRRNQKVTFKSYTNHSNRHLFLLCIGEVVFFRQAMKQNENSINSSTMLSKDRYISLVSDSFSCFVFSHLFQLSLHCTLTLCFPISISSRDYPVLFFLAAFVSLINQFNFCSTIKTEREKVFCNAFLRPIRTN